MRLIVTENAAMIADVFCEREAVYVGSAEDCRVHLPDGRVAAQQAVITPETGNTWALTILDSSQIVFLNGTRVTEDRVTLKTGDEVTICDFIVRVFPEQKAPAGGPAAHRTSVARLTQFVQSQLPPGSQVKRHDEPTVLQPTQVRRAGDLSARFGQTDLIEQLMDATLQAMLETFSAHRVWIGVRRVNYGPMDYVEGRLLTGQPTELPEFAEALKPRILDRGQFIRIPYLDREQPLSILTGPLIGPDNLLGMIYLDSGPTGRRFDEHDFDFFQLVCQLCAAQADAIFKHMARHRAATIQGEVNVAHAIQSRITPRKLPQWPALQFGAFREPGSAQPGNFYDIVRLGNDMAACMVSHTEATGAMPSMLMAQSQAAFRLACMHLDAPHVILHSLNWITYDGQQDHPLHAFVGVIEPNTGQLRYSIAGQLGAYIIGQRGDERELMPAEPLPTLGNARNTEYPLLSEQLDHGETLAVFTPGVIAATNRLGESFGEERFLDILRDGFGQLASTMLKEMHSDLRAFTEGGSHPDDITVVLTHRV